MKNESSDLSYFPKRTCIFCQQPLDPWEDWHPPDVGPNGYAGEHTLIYQCVPCKSQQDFQENGERRYYNFRVGLYWLRFHPNSDWRPFTIGKDPPDDIGNTETIMELNFLPQLTPQNTTEERIKLILLFS